MKKLLSNISFGLVTLALFTAGTIRAQYCSPDYYYGPSTYYYIDAVELNTISNSTGAGSEYNDYTDMSTLLIPGLTYELVLTNTPSAYMYYAAWIDWDQNEIFSTAEKLGGSDLYIYAGATSTISFTVPVTAEPGTTRMRIRCTDYAPGSVSACATTYYYGEVEDYSILVPTETDFDAGVTAIDLETACGLGSENVTVNITNIGTESISDFDVSYYFIDPISGTSATVTEAYSGPTLDSYETGTHTFSTAADLSNVGDYTFYAYTTLPDDTIPSDDTSMVEFTNIEVIDVFPYYEDFEDGASGWIESGVSSSWELGNPTGSPISGPPPATPDSDNSWDTNLDGNYNSYETSYITSPCLDLSSLLLPYMEIDIWWDTYAYNDGAQIEYSTDAGATWTLLGSIGSGDNWYSSYGYSLGYDPGTGAYENGWVGTGGGWKTAHHDISFLAGESSVKLRVKFASTWYPYYDGIAFDNIRVQDPFPDDVGVTAFISPVSSVELTASEVVSVEITNFGTNTQTSIPVKYQVDGGTIVSETWTGTLEAGETTIYSFSATYDMFDDGDYSFCAWTSLAGDDDSSNDTLCETIKNLSPIVGTNAYYIHYSSEDPFYSTDNVDKMDEIFGDGGWTEEYFDTMDPEGIFNENTCFVYLEGGAYTSVEFQTFLTNNGTTVENWVASGGNLFLNAAPWEGSNISVGFDGTTFVYPTYIYWGEATDPAFSILEGPYLPVGDDWTGWWYNFAHAKVTGTGLTKLIEDYYTPANAALQMKEWGDGTVLFGTMTPAEYSTPEEEVSNLRKNIFELLKYCSPVDLSVIDLISPPDGCGLDSIETIQVAIENLGPTAVSSFSVKYSLDGAAAVNEIATVVVDPGGIEYFTFDATGDFSALGLHTLEVWTDIYADEDHSNDTLYLEIENLAAALVDLGDDQTVCDSITLDAENPGMIYNWSTGGTSQFETIEVAGIYSVSVTHPVTGCVKSDTVEIELTYTPDASFDFTISGLTLTFVNTSSTGADYTWYFGDGTISNEITPTHTFPAGVYTCVLVAENYCGYSSFDTVIYVGVTEIQGSDLANLTLLYPNPSSGTSILNMNLGQQYDVRYEIYDITGKMIQSKYLGMITEVNETINMFDQPSGVYQVKIYAGDAIITKDLILNK
jgi:hypothetical protein